MKERQRQTIKMRALSAMLCAVLMCSLLPFNASAQVTPTGTDTTRDTAWIIAVNAAITDLKGTADAWKSHLADIFYEVAPFTGSGTGSLNWANPELSDALVWNGYEQGDLTANTGAPDAQKAAANPLDTSHTAPAEQQAAANMQPALDGTTYYVYSPQQLLFALRAIQNEPLTGYTISIENDLDMGGKQGYDWPDDIVITGQNTILGNNKTIYNLRVRPLVGDTGNSYRAGGLIRKAETLKASNLTFKNAHVLGYYQAGTLVGYFEPGTQAKAKFMELDNISVQDSLVISYGRYSTDIRDNGAGGIFGRRQMSGSVNTSIGGTVKNCNVQDSVITSLNHTGAISSALNYMDKAADCFSVGCTVISFGQHSGGLFSCIDKVTEISNCFVDANVYCKDQGGVFAGMAGNVHIYDCYSSGFMEGETVLGGFIGATGVGRNSTIINCYSTALVGLRSAGTELGGFVGRVPNATGYNTGFVNCYAAGEVGSASISADEAGPSHTYRVGGFAGSAGAVGTAAAFTSSRNYAAHCYYDKQTTAMREWNIGTMKNAWQTATSFGNPSLLGAYRTANEVGIAGVLTTDTDPVLKSGTGLTGEPGSAVTGFKGFKDMSAFYAADILTTNYPAQDVLKPALSAYPGWDYDAPDHYPELSVFSKANTTYAAQWGRWADLVAAYSKSSTSSAKLETWENGLNADTGEKNGAALPATTYDTVRDLTSRFDLTTAAPNQTWFRTQTATGAINTLAKTNILGSDKDVLVLTVGEPYYCDSFAPGIEWLETDVSVNGVTATRRFRVTPTAGVEAGASRTIYQPSEESINTAQKIAAFYDHADDVELYYTTAARFATNEPITTGIYPDVGGTETYSANHMSRTANALTERQKALSNDPSDGATSTYFASHGNNGYGGSGGPVGANIGIDASFMSRAAGATVGSASQGNSANGSRLFVYMRDVSAISASGQISPGSTLHDLYDSADNMDTFNGLALKNFGDKLLLAEYVWQLSDGRLVYDAKLIAIRTTPFSARINVYDAGGLEAGMAANKAESDENNGLKDTDDAYVDVFKLVGHPEMNAQVVTVPSSRTEDKLYESFNDENGASLTFDKVGPEYGDTLIASWRVTNPDKVVAKLHVSMDSGRSQENGTQKYFEKTILNPQNGSVVEIPYEYYRYISASDGTYYVQIETKTLVYTVEESDDKSFLYLVFNKEESGSDVKTDQGNLIDVLDVANNIQVDIELSPVLELSKRVTGTLGDQEMPFDFTLTLDNLDGTAAYPYYIAHADGTKTAASESGAALTVSYGPNAVSMKHGDRIVVIGLPYGSSYTIAEEDYSGSGYTAVVNGGTANGTLAVTATSPSAEGDHSADRSCSYLNSRNPSPPTGVSMQLVPFALILLIGLGGIILWVRHIKRRRQ